MDIGLLIDPNKYIHKYIKIFNEENDKYEKTISNIINIFPYNINYEDILTKVILINKIYNTNIFDVYSLANNIKNIGVDKYLYNKDLSLVDKIAYSYKCSNNIYCYSFSTKYCNFHNKNFPIFDSIVEEMLYLYMIKDKFSKFKKYELRNYNTFKNVIDDFIKFYKLNSINYKDLDKFLWQYGKSYLKI